MKKTNEKYLNTRDDESRKNYASNFDRIFGNPRRHFYAPATFSAADLEATQAAVRRAAIFGEGKVRIKWKGNR